FIDITKDIHEILLGYQENFWWDLEELSNKFNQILVSNGTIGNFLKELYQITDKQIILVHNNDRYSFFPIPPKPLEQKWKQNITNQNLNQMSYYTTPIYFFTEKIAELYIIDERR